MPYVSRLLIKFLFSECPGRLASSYDFTSLLFDRIVYFKPTALSTVDFATVPSELSTFEVATQRVANVVSLAGEASSIFVSVVFLEALS